MEENAVMESPMFNGDGVTHHDDQTPVEEESMTTTVLKDESRINWPGSDGDSEATPRVDDTSDDLPPPVTDYFPPPTTDDPPPPPAPVLNVTDLPDPVVDDDEVEPELEALADHDKEGGNDQNTLGVQIIITPGTPVPDSCESPPDFIQEKPSFEEDDSSYTEEQSPEASAATEVDKQEMITDDIITPEESIQVEASREDQKDSTMDDESLVETATEEPKTEDEPLTEQPVAEEPSSEEDASQEIASKIEEPDDTEENLEEVPVTNSEEQLIYVEPPPPEAPVTNSEEQDFYMEPPPPEPCADQQLPQGDSVEDTHEDVADSNYDDLVKPAPEDFAEPQKVDDLTEPQKVDDRGEPENVYDLNEPENVDDLTEPEKVDDLSEPEKVDDLTEPEKVENEDDTDSATISEGGSTPKHMPEELVNTSPQEDSIPQEVDIEPEEGEIEPQMAETEQAALPEDQNVDEEHIPSPETNEDTQNEGINGKERISAEEFFDEHFASETPDITDEPEIQEDKPPPVEEEDFAQTVKSDSSPSVDFDWTSEKEPEKPSETEPSITEPTVTEPEELSTESEKMGVKGEHVVDTQHKNKDSDRMTGSDKENESSQRSIGRSSTKRLDNNRFSQFNKSVEEVEVIDTPKSPVKKSSISNRLDRSRFAKFEMNNQTNGEVQPKKVTRNFVINKGAKKRFGSDSSDSGLPNSNECCVCKKRVYPMEKITADNKPYHKTCFRCTECKKCLSLGNYASLNGCLYCKPHFTQLFKLKGNYNDGFAPGASKTFQSKAQTGTNRT